MTKGTPSFGRFHTPVHSRCRRCGRHAFHMQKNRCSSCGFGSSEKLRNYAWNHKRAQRVGKLR